MDMNNPNTFNGQDYTILIVDDNPTNLGVVADYLEEYGFEIMAARDGQDALEKVQRAQPDLILLDVVMPGIDGFETCRRLKADEQTQDLPVIFMTALVEADSKVKGFEVGAVDYVTKPVQQKELLARIITHLRLRKLTRSLQQKNEQLEARSRVEKARLFEAVNQQREQLQILARRLTEVQEAERQRLARELHDEMGQTLTAIRINLAASLKDLPPHCPPTVRERLLEAESLADHTLEQIRELSLNLRPSMLDDLGLIPTLRWYVGRYTNRTDIKTELDLAGFPDRLPSELEIMLYRIIQEALTNAARHAQASLVRLHMWQEAAHLNISIEDNGHGFDLEEVTNRTLARRGAGLLGIQERVTILGGSLDIQTRPGGGTHLQIEVPWEVGATSWKEQ